MPLELSRCGAIQVVAADFLEDYFPKHFVHRVKPGRQITKEPRSNRWLNCRDKVTVHTSII